MTAPSVVFDCVVFLQAAGRPHGPAGACVQAAKAGIVRLLISDEIMLEVTDVLQRPALRKRFPTLTPAARDEFIEGVLRASIRVEPTPSDLRFSRDPRDLPYLNLAIQARAQYLVSRDGDLLSIPMSDDPEAARIRALAPDLRIVDPVTFLETMTK